MQEYQKQIFFYLMLIFQWIELSASCPSYCTCKWKHGKQTVECQRVNLTYIPRGLDAGTQVLDLSYNNLQSLQHECFEQLELINLQKIFLSHSRISKIHGDAFKGVSNLVELDLSHNFVSIVPSSTFKDYPSLMRLCLNENPIKTIRRHAFHPLSLLTSLELSNCDIEYIEIDAFSGLVSLEWLKLEGNKLERIQGSHLFPDSLHGVDLQSNIWNCDCELQDLHNWLVNFNAPNTVEPKCTSPPRLKGYLIKSVKENDLACVPEVSPTSFYIELNEFENVTLQCFINSLPQALVSWWYDGQMLVNNTTIEPDYNIHFYKEENQRLRRSELTIINLTQRDNGTFECIAENSAGRNQANFTIRVIIKQEPKPIEPIYYNYRCKTLIISVCSGLAIIILLVILVSILKCKRGKEQQRRNSQSHGGENSSKASTLNSFVSVVPPKVYENALDNDQNDNSSLRSPNTNHRVSLINLDRTIYFSPTIGSFNADKNPDLISDAETMVKSNKGLNFYESSSLPRYQQWQSNPYSVLMLTKPNIHCVKWKDQSSYMNALNFTIPRGFSANVQTVPYPSDFGLPIPEQQPPPTLEVGLPMYRTLPHKRAKKFEWDGQGIQLRTMEEIQPQNGENAEFIPSPPEGYKSDQPSQCANCSSKIGTSSSTKRVCSQIPNMKSILEPCSESPDEGYVGDANDTTGT